MLFVDRVREGAVELCVPAVVAAVDGARGLGVRNSRKSRESLFEGAEASGAAGASWQEELRPDHHVEQLWGTGQGAWCRTMQPCTFSFTAGWASMRGR